MKLIKLTGSQRAQFRDALLSAFPTQDSLKQMVNTRLEENLAAIAGGENYKDVIFNLITNWAEPNGKLDDLLTAARTENPGNSELREFAKQARGELVLNDREQGEISDEVADQTKFSLKSRVVRSLFASLGVLALIGMVRTQGGFQTAELATYDFFMNKRFPENWDERVVVIGASEDDLAELLKNDEIPDQTLNKLLDNLVKNYKPRIIGLDIFRDRPIGRPESPITASTEHDDLVSYIKQHEEIVATCKNKKSLAIPGVKPPKDIPSEQLSFGDVVGDEQTGKENEQTEKPPIRRQLLRMPPEEKAACTAEYALSYQVATKYLQAEGYAPNWNNNYLTFENKKKGLMIPINPMGDVFWTEKGPTVGYQNYDQAGYQMLINYRAIDDPKKNPERLSLDKFLSNQAKNQAPSVDENLKRKIENNIVIIGYTSNEGENNSDIHYTPIDPKMPGVVLQAHMVSQLVSAVVGGRKLIWYWTPEVEAVWILVWAFLSGFMTWRTQWRWSLALTLVIPFLLFGICWVFFLQAGWVPFVPTVLAVVFTSGVLWVADWTPKWVRKQIQVLKSRS